MEIYTIVFLIISCIYTLKNLFSRKKKYILVTLILFSLIAFRDISVGTDTENYINIFNSMSENPILIIINNIFNVQIVFSEILFGVYVFLLKLLQIKARGFIILSAAISIFIIMKFYYEHSRDDFITIFTFITIGSYIFFFSAIRQGIAIALVAIAYSYLFKRKIYKYFIIVLLATGFHATAIIMIPIYFIIVYRPKLGDISISILILSSSFILKKILYFILIHSNVSSRLTQYQDSLKVIKTNYLLVLMYIGILFFYLLKKKIEKIKKIDKNIKEIFLLFILGVGILIISLENTMISRFAMYLLIGLPILMSYFISNVKNKRMRLILKGYCILIEILFFYYTVPNSVYGIFNYKFY